MTHKSFLREGVKGLFLRVMVFEPPSYHQQKKINESCAPVFILFHPYYCFCFFYFACKENNLQHGSHPNPFFLLLFFLYFFHLHFFSPSEKDEERELEVTKTKPQLEGVPGLLAPSFRLSPIPEPPIFFRWLFVFVRFALSCSQSFAFFWVRNHQFVFFCWWNLR